MTKNTLLALFVLSISSGCALAAEPLAIEYKLTKGANVSLNIYDEKGRIVREVLHGGARLAGTQREVWDGRDNAGRPLTPAKYTWKMLGVPGFGTEYITNPGANYAVPNDGYWWAQSAGCHGGPQAVAVGSEGFYVGAFSENIETTVMKQSLNGATRHWSKTAPAPWEGFTSLQVARGQLWGQVGNEKLYRYDEKTGAKVEKFFNIKAEGHNPSDVSVTDQSVIGAYGKLGKIIWLDDASKATRSVAIEAPYTADAASDGTVYALAKGSLWKIAPDATEPSEFIKGLTQPLRVAVNSKNGDIYIAENEPSLQVKRFSSDGRLIKTYGKLGGRVDGLYQTQRESFRGVTDIAVEENGNFWVSEGKAAPRRVAKFAPDGKLRGEWYGGQVWAPWIAPEPDDKRFVWMASHWGDVMRCEVDYIKKSWKVHSTYRFAGMANGMVPMPLVDNLGETRMRNGQLYLLFPKGNSTVFKVDRTNWKLIPVSILIGNIHHDPQKLPGWLRSGAGRVGLGPNKSAQWTDANGDGLALDKDGKVQAGEVTYYPEETKANAVIYLDNDFNFISYAGPIKRRTVTGWNSVGAPIYGRFPGLDNISENPPRPMGSYDDRWTAFPATDAKGNVWVAYNPGIKGWGESSDAFIARYDPDGKLAWDVGRKGTTPGSMRTLRRIFGVVNDCVVAGVFSIEWPSEGPTPVYVFDKDGLYAGQIFGKPADATTPSWRYSMGAEGLSGVISKFGNDVYLYGHWINEARIFKINGWDGWQRASGSLEIPANFQAPEPIAEVFGKNGNGTGLQGEYFTSRDCSGTPIMKRVDPVDMLPAALGKYSVRWTGSLTPRRSGWHMFDQARGWRSPNAVWVNGVNVSEVDLLPPGSPAPGWPGGNYQAGGGRAIWLDAGRAYSIRIDYRLDLAHPSGAAGLLLKWSEPETNGDFQLIPTSQLSPTTVETAPGKPGK